MNLVDEEDLVRSPYAVFFSASCMTVRISLMPLVTAEKSMKRAFVSRAMMRASVVLPTPGGPQKIIEKILSSAMSFLSIFPLPTRCCCPT